MDDDPMLASLSLTHVRYNPSDPISFLSAWLALVPQALCVIYVTLIWSTREIEVALMFAGQMACEALNFGLKRWFKEQRPQQMFGKGYGMPSSHSQFVSFFSVSLTLFLLFRHVPSHTTDYRQSTMLERSMLSLLAVAGASSVALSRIYLNYHTPKQVWVGVAAGAAFAILYFLFTTALRQLGWIEWALETSLARLVRMRDLITTEDLQDAGWGRWEARQKLRKRVQSGKKHS